MPTEIKTKMSSSVKRKIIPRKHRNSTGRVKTGGKYKGILTIQNRNYDVF